MVYLAIAILGICLTVTNFIDKYFDYKKQKDNKRLTEKVDEEK